MVQILLPTLDGIPRRAGVPPLNPSKLQPVYPIRGEDAALDHFLFGGNSDSLFGLKGAASFTPVSASPVYQDNYLTTVDGVLNGLASSIAESPAFTVCMVVRYEIQNGKAVLYVGTTQAGNGDAKGWGLLRGPTSDTIQQLLRPNGSATAMPASNIPDALGKWIFLCMQVDSVAKTWRCWVGGATAVSGSMASAYAPSARGLGIGNAYYAPPTGTLYDRGVSVAELIAFDHIVSPEDLAAIYARSKNVRMADRGIAVF
ncbi:TPA: hypothetical protein ACJ509_000303 [Stenotrophomonas maltophilia]|jgi:hypothetical protein